MRFICVALSSLLLNDALMWMLAQTLPVFMARNMLGANILKIGAIGGTMLLSFFGMRLWVFVSRPAIQRPTGQQANGQFSFSPSHSSHPSVIRHSVTPLSIAQPPHQWTIQQPSTLLPDTRSCYASEPTMSLPAVHSRYPAVI